MKLLVFGSTGQVASEVTRAAAVRGWTCESLGRDRADLTDPTGCAATIAATDADIVINAAAYTAVDQAESERATAMTVNADAPGAMARAAAARGLPFLHVSTDYVFDGSGGRPWVESDATGPLGVYGASKLVGERQVIAAAGSYVILRTAWVFSSHGRNFVKTILRVGSTRDTLSVVDDQLGGPTPAAAIAEALLTVAAAFSAGQGKSGIFHFAGAPVCTWADFAEAILAGSRLAVRPTVARIPTSAYPTPARRPSNSALDCSAIRAAYGIEQPDWRTGLADVLKELETSE